MDGLILLVILIPLVFLILLVTILNRTGEQRRLLESLYEKIKQLNNEVSSLSKDLKEQKEDIRAKPVFKETPGKIIITEKPVAKEPLPAEPIKEKLIIPEPVLVEKVATDKSPTQKIKKEDSVEVIIAQEYQQ